jgi:TetR/AcrR family transcriptional regulator, tetracycline repressor protein
MGMVNEARMDDQKLSKALIVAEALALINEEGLDGLSLRALARRLGVRAPSLYWHVSDKNAVLAGVMEDVFTRCLASVPDIPDWREWMQAFGAALWQTQHEVRDFARLVTAASIERAQFARTEAQIRARLERLDLPLEQAVRLQSAVQALITGWSSFAHAPYADMLSDLGEIDQLVSQSLSALIGGWPGP